MELERIFQFRQLHKNFLFSALNVRSYDIPGLAYCQLLHASFQGCLYSNLINLNGLIAYEHL